MLDLIVGDFLRPTTLAATSLCRHQSGASTLLDQIPLHLSQCRQGCKKEFADRRCGINVFAQRAQANTFVGQLLRQLDQLLCGPAQPIKSPDNQRVAWTAVVQACLQLWSIKPGARNLVRKNLNAPSRSQRINLQRQLLIGGRYTGIPNQGRANQIASMFICWISHDLNHESHAQATQRSKSPSHSVASSPNSSGYVITAQNGDGGATPALMPIRLDFDEMTFHT